jgi:glycosyltransferase involved in cell wall biosynthesis
MSGAPGLWIGLLDIDKNDPVAALNGPPRADQRDARILVRLHHAPVGYVRVALRPESTLAERVRVAAQENLMAALARHESADSALRRGATADWHAQVACPRRFPCSGGAGISVVICTRNRPDRLRECLRSLRPVTYSPLEILVIDNAPADSETRMVVDEMAGADARIRYACEPIAGLSVARNHGLTKATFDLVAFTDDDTLVDPGWAAALAAGFAADPEAECVTGLVAARSLDTAAELYFDSRYSWGKNLEPRRYDLAQHRDVSGFYPFSAGIFGTGANFAVRRQAIDRLGGFDSLLGAGSRSRGGEDLDVFVRIILAGGRLCYVPSAVVWHQHRASTTALTKQLYSYGHGLGAYLAKRVIRHEMTARVIRQGVTQSAVVADQMRRAGRTSHLGRRGARLALMEVSGIVAGAACYYLQARRGQR